MNKKKFLLICAFCASLALAVFAVAQSPPATGQADQGSAQTASQAPQQSASGSAPSADPSADPSGTKSHKGGEMPKTASPLALVALLGASSLGLGAATHGLSKRFN